MMKIKNPCNLLIMSVLTFLMACQTLPQKVIVQSNIQWKTVNFVAEGKMAIRYPDCDQYRGCKQKAYSASYLWKHQASDDQVEIYNPLGQKMITLSYSGEFVTINDEKGIRTITQAEMRKQLGFSLPINQIKDCFFNHQSTDEFTIDSWKVQLKNWQPMNYYTSLTMHSEQYYLRILISNIKKTD